MAAVWQVQEAKSRLSELLDRAVTDGPQVITRHGRPVARVVAIEPGKSANEAAGGRPDWLAFLLSAPKSGLPEGLPPMPRSTRGRKPLFGEE